MIKKEKLSNVISDKVTSWVGSWSFIFSILSAVLLWVGLNSIEFMGWKPVDKFPFMLATGILSVLVIPQGSLILMSQRRLEEKDRARDEEEFRINIKNEKLIEILVEKISRMEKDINIERELLERHGD